MVIGIGLCSSACESPEEVSPENAVNNYFPDDYPEINAHVPANMNITWETEASLLSHEIFSADYARVHRINSSDLILSYHFGPDNNTYDNIAIRRSSDNGETWSEAEIVVEDNHPDYYGFANPDMLMLDNGWIILAYIGRGFPDDNLHNNVQIKISEDGGNTWGPAQIIASGRSWEPAIVQKTDGEIMLFYSSEARWWYGLDAAPEFLDNVQQEILAISSGDNGLSWSGQQRLAYTSGMRDGMAVPLELKNDKGLVFCIESVNHAKSPYIIWSSNEASYDYAGPGTIANQRRWLATTEPVWGGAPYMVQTAIGEVIMSMHDTGGRPVTTWRNNTMLVMVGNDMAQQFTNITCPWPGLPTNEGAINNSLFLEDENTIAALTSRIYGDGHGEVYWKKGHITY